MCGYGEPMLHKEINLICKKLSEAAFVEVVTNGDPLNPKKINELYVEWHDHFFPHLKTKGSELKNKLSKTNIKINNNWM